jgi:hypothetical protein
METNQEQYILKLLSSIDWFVWEDPESAHTTNTVQIPENIWNLVIFEDMINLKVPISRYYENKTYIEILGPITLKKFITEIYEFYKTELTKEDFDEINDPCDRYYEYAYKNCVNGNKVTYLDLIGSSDGNFNGPERRHPFSCNGLVRFEGIKFKRPNVYKLIMGS